MGDRMILRRLEAGEMDRGAGGIGRAGGGDANDEHGAVAALGALRCWNLDGLHGHTDEAAPRRARNQ